MVGGGVRMAPEGRSHVPERPPPEATTAPDPALQAEADLIAGN